MMVCAGAQSPYQFYRIYYDKGLSNSRINAIVQDRYGYMWFGSQDGLNRYDGYTTRSFFADGKNGLANNRITALYTDGQGRLWVGTYLGLFLFDAANSRFNSPDTATATGRSIRNEYIVTLKENGDGHLYMATNKSIYRLQKGRTQWENICSEWDLQDKVTNIADILFTEPHFLWVATSHKGFHRLDLSKKLADSYDYKTEFGDSCCYTINAMALVNKQTIAAGMLSYGLAAFDTDKGRFRTVPGFLGRNDSLRFNSVYSAFTDRQSRVWLGTRYFGIVQYFPVDNRVEAVPADPSNPFAYDGGVVSTFYEDRQGNIWVGTLNRGVYRFHPGNSVVYFPPPRKNSEGTFDEVRSLMAQDSSIVWMGTEKGPVWFDAKNNRFKEVEVKTKNGLPADKVMSMTRSLDGATWIATEKAGLIRYNGPADIKRFSAGAAPAGLPSVGVTQVVPLGSDELLLVSARRISRINTTTYRTTTREDSGFALSTVAQVSDIIPDGEKGVWVSTYRSALFYYDIGSGKLTEHPAVKDIMLTGGLIYKIVLHKGRIYGGTVNGIIAYDPVTQQLTTLLNDPAKRNITGMMATGGDLWFCNEHTVGKISLGTGAVQELDYEIDNHFLPFTGSLLELQGGTILCGTSKGFISIDPLRFGNDLKTIVPHITSFHVLGTHLSFVDEHPVELRYDQNFFSFDMSAFDYLQAGNIEYAYMLEGFDKEWHHLGKLRTANYTNVPAGKYKLKLKARTSSGRWVINENAMTIRIRPAFWQTVWFKIGVALLLLGTVYAVYRYRLGQINKEARIRSDFAIRLNELENSALRTQMNPHFIFNSLNTINSFISRNETAQAHQYISKFSKLIRNILDHSRQRKILLSDELEVLQLYIQIERIRFQDKFDFTVELGEGIDPTTLEIPPLIIQPFVENAILHGLLPLPGKGFLKIGIDQKDGLLWCTVQDNGIGREKAREMRKGHIAKHKSHGIEITLKRINLFNAEHGKEAEVKITDVEGGGTKVEIPVAWEDSF